MVNDEAPLIDDGKLLGYNNNDPFELLRDVFAICPVNGDEGLTPELSSEHVIFKGC
tara:strand:- start:1093 stop:1260 length:168 start_codon:yes stop_codon:yes gene_type:complete